MENKALNYISISQKAGAIVTGEGACEKAISTNTGKLVIIAEDASDNTKKKFINKSTHYNIPYYIAFTREELSIAIGKNNRPTIVITDKGLGERIEMELNK